MLKITIEEDVTKVSSKYERAFRRTSPVMQSTQEKVMRDIKKYVPRDTGALMNSAKVTKMGEIVWDSPYAKYVYSGKTSTGKPMTYKKINSHAGPRWVERYTEDNMGNLVKHTTNELKKAVKKS